MQPRMKTLFPTAIALLAGFAGGWLAKPAPATATASGLTQPSAPPQAKPPGPDITSPPPVRQPVIPSDTPAPSGVLPTGPLAESIEGAKLQRLVELLGLDQTSQAELKKILEDCRKTPPGDPSKPANPWDTLALLTKTGEALEQSLASLFTPEQAAAFKELRQREQQNRIETKAQRDLGRIAESTDLTSAQRELILTKLRQSATAEMAALPPAASLLSSSSVLPLGTAGMPVDSMLELTHLSDIGPAADHGAFFARLSELKLARLDTQLAELKPLVTPAQYAQLEAAAARQREIRRHILQPAPPAAPPVQPGNP
jgi:hypothetical protein